MTTCHFCICIILDEKIVYVFIMVYNGVVLFQVIFQMMMSADMVNITIKKRIGCIWMKGRFKSNMDSKSRKQAMEELSQKFEFRNIKQDEAEQAVAIEQICFPPNEACSEKHMRNRIAAAPELFLVAVDKETGKIAGFLNGLATDEYTFRDEFFTDAGLYNPKGKNVMLLGLDVLPEYRKQGLGRELVFQYLQREREKGRRMLLLTCLKSKVKMYEKFGFVDQGISGSTWGGEEWHEMSCTIVMD